MLTDYQATLSNEQALTGNAASTNVYDSSAPYDISRGEPLGVMITIDVAANFTGDETYEFIVQTDNDEAFGSSSNLIRKTVDAADLVEGAVIILPYHTGQEQYTRMSYILGGTTPTITLTSELKPLCDIQTYTDNLPSGYVVNF